MGKSVRKLLSHGARSLLCVTLASGPVLAEGAGDMSQQNNQQQQLERRARQVQQQQQQQPQSGGPPPAINPEVRREQERQQRRQVQQQQPQSGGPPPAINPEVRREQERQERLQQRGIDQQFRGPERREIERRSDDAVRREGIDRQQRERAERQQREQEQRREAERAQRERIDQQQRRDFGDRRGPDRRDWDRDRNRRDYSDRGWRDNTWWGRSGRPRDHYYVYVNRRPIFVAPERRRVYRNIVVLRPYGHWYHGYGRYYSDAEAYRWLGLTALTVGLVAYLNEAQQRSLEHAQVVATTAPIGQPITWWDHGAGGEVIATRDGWSESGLYCREFQQTVQIGGQSEQAFGTACQQPDGAWQVTTEQ